MFGKKKPTFKPALITSVIGKGVVFNGNISFVSGILIEGVVRGTIRAEDLDPNSLVIIHNSAVIHGDIHSVNVILDGVVEGSVFCRHFAELNQNCKIHGDLHYHVVSMSAGSRVNGKLTYWEDGTLLLEHLPEVSNEVSQKNEKIKEKK